jgi:hypothetical protein
MPEFCDPSRVGWRFLNHWTGGVATLSIAKPPVIAPKADAPRRGARCVRNQSRWRQQDIAETARLFPIRVVGRADPRAPLRGAIIFFAILTGGLRWRYDLRLLSGQPSGLRGKCLNPKGSQRVAGG